MKKQLRRCFNRFAYAGCLPSDTESERLRKAILVSIPTGISLLAVFWVSGYLFLGRPISAAIPGSYAVLTILSVLVFFKTKHYGFFRFSQFFLILWLPFLLQWSLGGFNNGSVVMIWAILSPLGALMFHGVRQAVRWFLAYLALTVVSGVFDTHLAAAIAPLPGAFITVFYVMNMGCGSLLIYMVVNYFVVENKRIISALSEEKARTERALLEAEAQRAAAEQAKAVIEEQSRKLIEMDRIKSRFFANISHEFRTPLTLIIGPLEDCLAGAARPPKSQLSVMLRNCRRLLRLINQLLDISKLEAGEMKLNLQRGNLSEFLKRIARSFAPFAERKGVHLQVSAEHEEVECNFDAEKLDKIICNLLSNALKFTPEGGKVLLALSAAADGHEEEFVTITVKDTGQGIPKEAISYIFDRFHQVDGSSTREHEGTGIGLSLVKDLVSLHGGRIHVKSELGFGTEFKVNLPRCMVHPEVTDLSLPVTHGAMVEIAGLEQGYVPEHGDVSLTEPASADTPAGRETVLIIDDNPDILAYLKDCLTPDYNVMQAADGLGGLRLIREALPDLIICDIMMPRMDGYELCRTVKTDKLLKRIPLILLTAKAAEEMKVEGLEAGADDYVAKPFNSKELAARVKNLLMIHKQQKELEILNEQLEAKVKEQLEAIFKSKRLTRYFPNKMLERILSSEEEVILSSERRNITLFFSDLSGFTELTDRMEPEQITILLNEYMAEMVELIVQHGATLDKFMGDGLMAIFGAPDEMDKQEQAQRAVSMAVLMKRKLNELGRIWSDNGIEHDINLRMGIHQDYVTVGNFGSEQLMEYTAIGKGVNLASRLEANCSPGKIKVSYPVYMLTKETFTYDDLEEETYKGFTRPIRVSELDPEKAKLGAIK